MKLKLWFSVVGVLCGVPLRQIIFNIYYLILLTHGHMTKCPSSNYSSWQNQLKVLSLLVVVLAKSNEMGSDKSKFRNSPTLNNFRSESFWSCCCCLRMNESQSIFNHLSETIQSWKQEMNFYWNLRSVVGSWLLDRLAILVSTMRHCVNFGSMSLTHSSVKSSQVVNICLRIN